MKIIAEVMTSQNLPAPVMNVLIHYVLLQTDMRLTKNYLAKIASHWSRAKLKNAQEAMKFAKDQLNKRTAYQNKQKNNRKSYNKEVVPDWFRERQQQNPSQPSAKDSDKLDDAKEREKLAAMLKEFSEGS
ncbi:Replication initiation and membrane attachment protein [Lentibacillus sp. JNUCC-1]|uniref:DnaD domain protein n=1 Tax=Lentibacillus sp. JNUCC-1 TaxID=2654513 RepID=UPI001325D2B3|nr:DnaD domain protein [Lentibacillus sp. JNUCC-1]MUV39356.1 Replication initiation and membrane attachment protein [Lentibacillus sp. JNUCC-1]